MMWNTITPCTIFIWQVKIRTIMSILAKLQKADTDKRTLLNIQWLHIKYDIILLILKSKQKCDVNKSTMPYLVNLQCMQYVTKKKLNMKIYDKSKWCKNICIYTFIANDLGYSKIFLINQCSAVWQLAAFKVLCLLLI